MHICPIDDNDKRQYDVQNDDDTDDIQHTQDAKEDPYNDARSVGTLNAIHHSHYLPHTHEDNDYDVQYDAVKNEPDSTPAYDDNGDF